MRKILVLSLLFFGFEAVAEDTQFIIRVDGVTCPFCVATSERTIAKIKGVHSVNSDLKAGIIYVCAAGNTDLSGTRLAALFRARGFTYRSVRKSEPCDANSQLGGKKRSNAAARHAHNGD